MLGHIWNLKTVKDIPAIQKKIIVKIKEEVRTDTPKQTLSTR